MYRWVSCGRGIVSVRGEDPLFGGRYIVDPYQKCDLSCVYCDSAEECIYIKHDILERLKAECKDLERKTVILGSSTDPYQIIERRVGITRKVLRFLLEEGFPVHILTKSCLIERDIDLLRRGDVRVTVSISTLDERISSILEPKVPSPRRRLETLRRLSMGSVEVGVAIFPIIPFLTERTLPEIVELAKEAGASYVIYGYLELKGDVRIRFFDVVDRSIPSISSSLRELYRDSFRPKGYNIDGRIREICKSHGLRLFHG